ncbi:MAG TPA: hypothetical protein VJL29_11370 [Thermoguttaceae bacterium]|nr:hypothetical protein [Thermoguttaceae bacterium]
MEAHACHTLSTATPAGPGHWNWWGLCLWLPGCIGFGALLAWAAFEVGQWFSPLVVFPLLVGLVLGVSLVAMMRLFQMGHRPTAWLALGLAAVVVIAGQHYFSYRAAVVEANRASEQLQKARTTFGTLVQGRLPAPPTGPIDYLRRRADEGRPLDTVLGNHMAKGWLAWLSWALDGLLVLGPAAAMVAYALRRPFCGRCGSWYATRRAGPLDAQAVQQLVEILGLSPADTPKGGRYRLISCNQGCAPTGFSLSWKELDTKKLPEILWLDDQQHTRVIEILDHSQTGTQGKSVC